MPQASDDLRAKWGGDQGIGEDKAAEFLASRGWKQTVNGLWITPPEPTSEDEWEALTFLIDEWDHDYVIPMNREA